MSELKTNLDEILQEKQNKIIPKNIKKDIQIFDVIGTYEGSGGGIDTSDATATSDDILYPKTAYVNGEKITGGIEATYIQQLQDVSMQSITVDSAIRIVCVCKTNNVIFTCNATGDITTFYARKFVDNAILEELDSYVIDTGEIYSVSCNDVLNKNGNLSIFFVTRVTSEYCNVYAIEFDLTSGKFKTDTLATLPLLNNSKSWFPYIIVNPLEPDVALTFSMDRHNSYIRTFVYKDNILTGSNIITINDTVARFVEWGTDGKYIISKGYMDTGGNVYIYNYNNNELTLTFNNTYTSPICLYQEGYFITDNKLYTQQGQVVKEYTDLGITNQDYCYIYKNLLFIIRNYSSESDRLDIYCINNDYTLSSVFTQDIDWTMNRYFSTVENNDAIGTPYCPVSNTTTLLLSQNGQGYNLSVIPSDNVLLSLKIGNKNYIDVSSAIINDTDVLEGKQFFASISSKRVGTMPNNGELNYTPNTTQQTIPAGYTSGGTVVGDSNLIPENIKKDISIFDVTGTYEGDNISDYISEADNMGTSFTMVSTIKQIPLLDTSSVTNMQWAFRDCINLTTIPLLNTSNVTNMADAFNNCQSLEEVPLLDTSSVTRMDGMFRATKNLTTIPQFNTINVTDMGFMFAYSSGLVTVPVLNTGKVTDMGYMFESCPNLSNDSLNNILQMCIDSAITTASDKTLKDLRLSEEQAQICTTLSNYQAFLDAGWTTGY